MAETTFHCDMSSWPFEDLAADGLRWSVQAGVSDGEIRHQNFDDFNIYPSRFLAANDCWEEQFANDLSASSLANSSHFQLSPIQNTNFEDVHQLHDFNNMASSRRTQEFDAMKCQFGPESVGDMIRSTSQLAKERALYMNSRANPQSPWENCSSHASLISNLPPNFSPDLGNCSSPSTNHTNESDDDTEFGNFHFYSLPDGLPLAGNPKSNNCPLEHREQESFVSGKRASEDDCLTPLEMPDGSMRLTSNWLPVDPKGGFTIAGIGIPSAVYDGPPGDGSIFDMEPPQYGENAFFSVDSTLPTFEV
ncbi:hypothetical protein PHISCL_04628 [Aspergillus sclerotialis]|uniref:Uncharacterized protein n=1 Tax=Aspergillus sclerotialis TaxID=2070753 RepID=A0A3A2ZL47_9EURO|nr:hypothetical protein PHISCL_04628 [Aspergillus sclerotialis]